MPVADIKIPELLAIWGAVLSTVLFIFKLVEVLNNRLKIDADFISSSNESNGHKIKIRNLSNKTFIVAYWELILCLPFNNKSDGEHIAYADIDSDHRMDPYATMTLNFTDSNYFSITEKFLKGRNIYIRLHIAGRKPIYKLVYKSS